MRLARLALPLIVLSFTGASIAVLEFSPAPQNNLPIESVRNIPQEAPITAVEGNSARDVGQGAVPTPVLPNAPLERIAPAPVRKLLEIFGPPVPPPNENEPFLLFQPVVENAGTLLVEGRKIVLAGVVPLGTSRICLNFENQEWPCGIKAKTEFRALVRGRAISCQLPDQQQANIETECKIGKLNLGEWLVEHGWAEAKPGSELERLGEAAKLLGRGIYNNGT